MIKFTCELRLQKVCPWCVEQSKETVVGSDVVHEKVKKKEEITQQQHLWEFSAAS